MIDFEPVYQRGKHDCGAAVVAAVLKHFGQRTSLSKVARELNTTEKDGTDPRAIEAYLRRLGFCVCSGSMTVADLYFHTGMKRPVIAVTRSHWLTVIGCRRGNVHFCCPIVGKQEMNADLFVADWVDTDRFGATYERFGIAVWL